MAFSRAEVLAAVDISPAAAAAHDRDQWVAAFTPDGRIESPVGSQPHRGRAALGRFYDTFIGPRDIVCDRDIDIVAGSTVIRDVELEVTMAPTLTLRISSYLRYDMADVDGELKIAALSAFWELPAMAGRFLRGGLRSVPAGLQLSQALLVNQGAVGTLGMLGGWRGAGHQGKRQLLLFVADARAGDEVAVRRRLTKGARMTIDDDAPLSTADLLTRLAGARLHKLIGSGHHLVVGVDRGRRRDVLAAEATAKPFGISRIRYFTDSDQP